MEWDDYKLLLEEYLYLLFSGMEHSFKKPNGKDNLMKKQTKYD